MYQHIEVHAPVHSVMRHPAFDGRGKLLFPWDDEKRYSVGMTMADMPRLHLWHTNMSAGQMVDGVNRLIDDRCWSPYPAQPIATCTTVVTTTIFPLIRLKSS